MTSVPWINMLVPGMPSFSQLVDNSMCKGRSAQYSQAAPLVKDRIPLPPFSSSDRGLPPQSTKIAKERTCSSVATWGLGGSPGGIFKRNRVSVWFRPIEHRRLRQSGLPREEQRTDFFGRPIVEWQRRLGSAKPAHLLRVLHVSAGKPLPSPLLFLGGHCRRHCCFLRRPLPSQWRQWPPSQ